MIEDNAQAIDAAGDGFKIGELSDATSISFIIQKNLGTFGDGGALVTNNADIDATVRRLRNHGSNKRNVHSFGFNSRLDDIHAGILSAKLKHIHKWNDDRIQWAERYTAGLRKATQHRPALRAARLPPRLPSLRDRDEKPVTPRWAARFPRQERRSTRRPTTPSPSTSRTAIPGASRRASSGRLPNAESNAASCVSLPMYPGADRQRGRLRRRQSPRVGQVGQVTPRYRVVVVGMGKRGVHHAAAFAANPRFELAGICSSDQKRLDAAAAKFGRPGAATDARQLAEDVKPDVFCFCTPPNVRLPLIERASRAARS